MLKRIRNRSKTFKILVVTEYGKKHVMLMFEDLAAGYHIETVEELDKIIDALQTIRNQAFSAM